MQKFFKESIIAILILLAGFLLWFGIPLIYVTFFDKSQPKYQTQKEKEDWYYKSQEGKGATEFDCGAGYGDPRCP